MTPWDFTQGFCLALIGAGLLVWGSLALARRIEKIIPTKRPIPWCGIIQGDGEIGEILCPDCAKKREELALAPFREPPKGRSCACGREA